MVDFADRAKNPSLGQARTVRSRPSRLTPTHNSHRPIGPKYPPNALYVPLLPFGPSSHLPFLAAPADPERLGRALVTNVPFLVNAFFKLITPFIDPLTRPKLRFNPDCLAEGLFAPPQLLAEWGGAATVAYEHDKYWAPLVRMCAERRERMWEQWRARGAKVGVREWDMKCAIEQGEATPAPVATEPTKEEAKKNGVAETVAAT